MFFLLQLPLDIYKDVLLNIHEHVLPHMPDPRVRACLGLRLWKLMLLLQLLMDFLTDSYNIGGVISILALHGLFVLINKYHLFVCSECLHPRTHPRCAGRDYPDFYAKLYKLFDPNVFLVKHRSKFFKLADLFLRSTFDDIGHAVYIIYSLIH